MAYVSEFPDLFYELLQDDTEAELIRRLADWLPRLQVIKEFQGFQRFNDVPLDKSELNEALWSWYALSRISDLLLQRIQGANQPGLSPTQYSDFWSALGFAVVWPAIFHPFDCEVFAVETANDELEPPRVIDAAWPALMWGEMLFSRAGVRAGSQHLLPCAATTPLFFAYWRGNRKAVDLSHGWGSNSQWRTNFRRDYATPTHYLFNVDGKKNHNASPFLLGHDVNTIGERQFFASVVGDDYGLSQAQREELLLHRCFVTQENHDDSYWPFYDCLVNPRS